MDSASQPKEKAEKDHEGNKMHSAPPAKYTDILFNSPPTETMSIILVLLINFAVGSAQGYQSAIILDLQELGVTYKEQSYFSFVFYPYLLKFLAAPFIDRHFSRTLGKSRTYILASGILLSIFFILISFRSEDLILRKQVWTLTWVWTLANLLLVFTQIAGEMWILKLFEADSKSKGGMYFNLGLNTGNFVTYNLFVPLNSVKWLNANLFASKPVTAPLVSHTAILLVTGGILLATTLYILVFVAEKEIEDHENLPSMCKIVSVFPGLFVHKNLRKFLIFIALSRMYASAIDESLTLKLIDGGIPKTAIVNIQTLAFIPYIISNIYLLRFFKRGRLMQNFYLACMAAAISCLYRYVMILDLQGNKATFRTEVNYFIYNMIWNFAATEEFFMGFLNTIAPEEIGSTFLTSILSFSNASKQMPQSLGLYLVDHMNYNILALSCTVIQTVTLLAYIGYPRTLDYMAKEE